MDDTEDDARYPPNPYRSDPRRQFPSSHRPQPIGRNYAADDDEDDEEEQNDADQAADEPDHDDEEEDDEDGYAAREDGGGDDDEDDSSESRGKRRKIDRYALGFEFAPRAAPAAKSLPPPPPPPPSTRSLADWSEESTFMLLDTWGNFYLQNGRKSIRSDEWSEVAKKVCQVSKTARTDAQCRNRLDTLKKKYRKEMAKIAEGTGFKSEWVYFSKMDALMSPPSPPQQPASRQQQQQQQPPRRLPCGLDAGEYVFTGSRVHVNRANGMDEMRDSPGDTGSEDDDDDEDEESDELPPRREKHRSDSSFRMLADSIQKFGEIYEKIENNKRQQMVELEKMRNEFHRDLEVQKRQILERAQAEIANIRQEEGEEKTGDDDSGDDDENDVST